MKQTILAILGLLALPLFIVLASASLLRGKDAWGYGEQP